MSITDDAFRKFDKETLVQYLFRHSYYRHDILRELVLIEKDLLFQKIMARKEKILEEMRLNTGFENRVKYMKLLKEDTKLQKQINKLLDLNI